MPPPLAAVASLWKPAITGLFPCLWRAVCLCLGWTLLTSLTLGADPLPPEVRHTLTIESIRWTNGAPVVLHTTFWDLESGATPLSRSFPQGTEVSVQAAWQNPQGGYFHRWELDGKGLTVSLATVVLMDGPHTLTAVYDFDFPTPIPGLLSFSIQGPLSVPERTSAQYFGRILEPGGSAPDPETSWSVLGPGARISRSGVLDTDSVDADQEIKLVGLFSAGSEFGYVTNTVIIRNTDPAPLYTLSLSTSGGGAITNAPGGSRYPAGTLVSLRAVPRERRTFSNWSGDASGTNDTVIVRMDADRAVRANFVSDFGTGALQVEMVPLAVGGSWNYDASTLWLPSGATRDGLPPATGRYVTFTDIPGWVTPKPVRVDITTGTTNHVRVQYGPIPGTVQVTLAPAAAVAAGARWRLDGRAWLTNGATVPDPMPGPHLIEFEALPGWTTPPSQTVMVPRGNPVLASGVYRPMLGLPVIGAVSPKFGPIEGGTLLTLEGANFSPNTTVFIGGRAAKKVTTSGTTRLTAITPANPGQGEVDLVVTTPAGSVTKPDAFTYGLPLGTNLTFVTSAYGRGLAVAANTSNLFVGRGTTFQVFDLTIRTNPTLLASLPLPGLVQDIALEGNLAVAALDQAGVQLVDISNPAAPRRRGYYRDGNQASVVKVLERRAYVIDAQARLLILDLANPDAPVRLASLETGTDTRDVALKRSGDRLFALVAVLGRVLVIEVTNPQAPATVATVETLQADFPHELANYALMVVGDLVLVGQSRQGLEVIDLSDPVHPWKRPSIFGTPYCAVGAVSGNTLALTCGGQMPFQVLDVSGTVPTHRGWLPDTAFPGIPQWGRMVIQDGVAWVSTYFSLHGISLANPASPQVVFRSDFPTAFIGNITAAGSLVVGTTLGQAYGLTLTNDILTEVATLSHKTEDGSPVVVGDMLLDPRHAYFTENSINTTIYRERIQPGPSFEPLPSGVLEGIMAYEISPTDRYPLVLGIDFRSATFGPVVFELDPTRPGSDWIVREANLRNRGQSVWGTHVVGTRDFFVVAFSEDPNPTYRLYGYSWGSSNANWELPVPNYVTALKLSHGNRFLHVGMDREYRIYDLADPTKPVVLSTNTLPGRLNSLLVDGEQVFISYADHGIEVYDIADKLHPRLARGYWTAGRANALAKTGDRVVLATEEAGIQVLGLTDITSPQVTIFTPVAGTQFPTTDPPWTLADTLTLTGTTTDDSGQVHLVTWRNDRGGDGLASGNAQWQAKDVVLFRGTNVLTITAYDAAGNAGTASLTVISTPPDTTPPVISVTGPTPAPGGIFTPVDFFTLSGFMADNVAVADVTWRNSTGASGTAFFAEQHWTLTRQFQAGPNEITVTVTDAAGNSASDTFFVFITALPRPPRVTIKAPTLNEALETHDPAISLGGVVYDDFGLAPRVEWSNGRIARGVATGGFSWQTDSIPLQPGLNTIQITAYDAEDNTATDTLAVTYIPLPPLFQLAPQGLIDGTFRFQISGPANRTLTLLRSADFGTWESLGTRTLSAEGTATMEDTVSGDGQHFYRVLPTP